MIKMSMRWLVESVNKVAALREFSPSQDRVTAILSLHHALESLDGIYSQSFYSLYLRASAQQANSLRSSISSMIEKYGQFDIDVEPADSAKIGYELGNCLNILMSELGVVPTYLVTPKAGYDVNILVDMGEALFPEATLAKAPETESDMREAGKAMVFELPTACGFHVFRVLEAVLKRYWDHVANGADRPGLQTIGNFANELKSNTYGDAKVWETLGRISKLHRNPLIHPEVILSVEEAVDILGISRSAIGFMLRAGMPDVPATTGATP